jgi:mannose-6-phosphate isomerase-like protein (cupin superfamily)
MLYVIQGEVLLLVTDVESKVQASVSLRAGDLAVIQTGVAHALRPVEPGQAIEFSATRFDPADIQPFRLA